jgi:uncharacterized cupin superfamily protein
MSKDVDVPIVHGDDVEWGEARHGEHFAHRRCRLSRAAGGRGIGCSLVELAPGKTGWPFHYHLGNEEAIYMLAGEATLRLGEGRHRVRAGHYIALPKGDAYAHQMTNTGTEPCRYLVMSTMVDPDVAVYPDSNKIGAVTGTSADGYPTWTHFPRDGAVAYWHGEPAGDVDPAEDALEEKLGLGRLATASARVRDQIKQKFEQKVETLKAAVGRNKGSADAPNDALDQQIDAEIDALKKKLGLT